MRRLAFLAATLLSMGSGCSSTHQVALTYRTPANLAPPAGSPIFAVAEVVDQRQKGPNELGGVRSGFGNLLKRIQTSEPVADLVSRALQGALREHGLLADGDEAPRILLRTSITRLDCNSFSYSAPGTGQQVGNREAHAHLDVEALDADTKSLLWKETYAADIFEPAGAAIFEDVDTLRGLVERAMSQAVDRAVTDSQVRSQASAGSR
jgi:hypothetical protein